MIRQGGDLQPTGQVRHRRVLLRSPPPREDRRSTISRAITPSWATRASMVSAQRFRSPRSISPQADFVTLSFGHESGHATHPGSDRQGHPHPRPTSAQLVGFRVPHRNLEGASDSHVAEGNLSSSSTYGETNSSGSTPTILQRPQKCRPSSCFMKLNTALSALAISSGFTAALVSGVSLCE